MELLKSEVETEREREVTRLANVPQLQIKQSAKNPPLLFFLRSLFLPSFISTLLCLHSIRIVAFFLAPLISPGQLGFLRDGRQPGSSFIRQHHQSW